MGKSKKPHQNISKGVDQTGDWRLPTETTKLSEPCDRHDLYQKAVQSPAGDISYMLRFFRQYVGLQVPLHLREDFSGTSFICATWCKADVRRTALGIDIDREALAWGWRHNGQALLGQPENQMCLVQANVLQNLATYPDAGQIVADQLLTPAQQEQLEQHILRPADVICALNFSVFLLSSRQKVVEYFRLARAAMSAEDGGIFLLDMLGGHAAESVVKLHRQNEISGLSYLWEQARYDPVKRQLTCHISLKDPQSRQVLKHAFTYHWKIWTIPEVLELLHEAGFKEVHVWMRCMIGTEQELGDSPTNRQGDIENEFEIYDDIKNDSRLLARLSKGWTAYLVAVLHARTG
ncbi:hypothetical protein ABBQ38_005000 [Trebouxia sp. C0009 RCD-2024]